MKLNTRTLAFAVALGAVAAANAADVRFWLGYGDNAFAALNGASVGSELKATSVVPAVGSTFTVSIFATSTLTTDAKYGAGALFVGFDTASTNGTGNYADAAAAEAAGGSKMLSLANAFSNKATGQDGFLGASQDAGTVDYTQTGAEKFSGVSGTGTSMRSIGLWQAFGWGTGNNVALKAGATLRLADLVVTNKAIGAGMTYGDESGENGLTLNSVANATSRSTFFATNPRTGGNPGTDVKYALTNAVPEPGTMIALVSGLAAVAARRRRK